MVLRQRFRGLLRPEARTKDVLTKPRTNRFVKLAVMGLTVALGAAALAVVKSALEWAPKFHCSCSPKLSSSSHFLTQCTKLSPFPERG